MDGYMHANVKSGSGVTGTFHNDWKGSIFITKKSEN